MNKEDMQLYVKIENSRGINKFEYTFKFNESNSIVCYAPNGTMKSSFADTIDDWKKGRPIKDQIFCEVSNEEGKCILNQTYKEKTTPLEKDNILVIHNTDLDEKCKVVKLLLNDKLKKDYDMVTSELKKSKEDLGESFKTDFGYSRTNKIDIFELLQKDFNLSGNTEVDQYLGEYNLDSSDAIPEYLFDACRNHEMLFNQKVLNFMNSNEMRADLQEYVKVLKSFFKNSPLLSSKKMSVYNYKEICNNLKKHHFFDDGNKLWLATSDTGTTISSVTELEAYIKQQIEMITMNTETDINFSTIYNKIHKNQDLRDFDEYIKENCLILTEYADIKKFKLKLWKCVFEKEREKLELYQLAYKKCKSELERLEKIAQEDKPQWKETIDIFNSRFHVPYTFVINNSKEAILGIEMPNIELRFDRDWGNVKHKTVDQDKLMNVISEGEKRAFHMLNSIHSINLAVKEIDRGPLVIIFDDIADAFDYKNKYVIVEYLYELSNDSKYTDIPIYFILLTHNFDLYRLVGHNVAHDKNCYFSTRKENGKIEVERASYFTAPYKNQIKSVSSLVSNYKEKENINTLTKLQKGLIALVPYARSLCEIKKYAQKTYNGNTCDTKGENFLEAECDFKNLTRILHINLNDSSEDKKMDLNSLLKIYKRIFGFNVDDLYINDDRTVDSVIHELAETIVNKHTNVKEDLNDKMILSMSTRLTAEEYMFKKIKKHNDKYGEELPLFKNNQTSKLLIEFKKCYGKDEEYQDNIKILTLVNIFTSENIHCNSFMIEPIVDTPIYQLKDLWKKVELMQNDINR